MCWMDRQYLPVVLPESSNTNKYLSKINKKLKAKNGRKYVMSTDDIANINMKSRSYYGYKIRNYNETKGIAVVMFESLKPKLDKNIIDTFMDKHDFFCRECILTLDPIDFYTQKAKKMDM